MSAPSADGAAPSTPGNPGAPGNAGAVTIVLVALGLMVLAAAGAFLFLTSGKPVDGAALLAERLGVSDFGAGWSVVESREVPFGSRIVVVEDRRLAPETPLAPKHDAPTDEVSKDGEEPRFDWKKVAIPSTTPAPRKLVFVFPDDREKGRARVEEILRDLEWTDLDDLGAQGGRTLVAKDKVAWRGFDAAWAHLREFERAVEFGGTFRDSIQVDLSLARSPCLMTAIWTRGEPASRAELTALLARLTPADGR